MRHRACTSAVESAVAIRSVEIPSAWATAAAARALLT